MLKILLLLTTIAHASTPAPVGRKMHCVCCAETGQDRFGRGGACGAGGGPDEVTFVATPANYKEVGEKLCRQNMVDQSQTVYVADCGYVN
jgi:hypothetical protein